MVLEIAQLSASGWKSAVEQKGCCCFCWMIVSVCGRFTKNLRRVKCCWLNINIIVMCPLVYCVQKFPLNVKENTNTPSPSINVYIFIIPTDNDTTSILTHQPPWEILQMKMTICKIWMTVDPSLGLGLRCTPSNVDTILLLWAPLWLDVKFFNIDFWQNFPMLPECCENSALRVRSLVCILGRLFLRVTIQLRKN